ncbi:dynamin family protein [Immersiella caudata]|uniref:Dynamin family protein n=1 Tax=Immersiella caudata TaxID=314043 RepID=A0AA39WJY1_9PEZI|nr:dynamin family protein [Immersiella caudata]
MTTASGSGAALTSPTRLRKIDVLREKNIGQYIPLPQLVAVGDQSSGKSSLLESITGIPFPRGQELCTRYATQITHRRDDFERIDVSIIPGPHASPEHREKLKSFHCQFQSNKELLGEFPTLLNKVNKAMQIRTNDNPEGVHTFSEDVLKIEKCGPSEDYLTVIDVPGIFRATAEGITAKDRDLVKNMVKRYIKDDRTIILAVVPANVDVATQEILELAKEYDTTGDRTLGVLTKPDTVKEKSQKMSVCNLVLGHRMPLTLGYFIVRNRGGDDEETQVDFTDREKMFLDDPWSTLPRDRIGVLALRERLQELLGQITDKAFPKLLSEIRGLFNEAVKKWEALGPSRNSERKQQTYLMKVVTKFQEFVRDALAANYSHDDAFNNPDLRLITTILNVTANFNREFASLSHSHSFKAFGKDVRCDPTSSVLEIKPKVIATLADPEVELTGDETCCVPDGAFDEYPELLDFVVTDWEVEAPEGDIMEWIGKMRRESRGVELGTFSSTMFASAFREQSQKWRGMTESYISRIILVIHRFVHRALEFACPDVRMNERLRSMIMDGLLERYHGGLKHALMLVAVEREKRPYTWSGVYSHNVQGSRGQRIADSLASKARLEHGRTSKVVVDHNLISTAITNRGNVDFEKEEIHDTLAAYYNVARKRFVDNIWHQAVDHTLLSGPTSPLGLLSEQWVMTLDNGQLEIIAGELPSVIKTREALGKRILDLKEAMAILR